VLEQAYAAFGAGIGDLGGIRQHRAASQVAYRDLTIFYTTKRLVLYW